jgi:hypothetical protein
MVTFYANLENRERTTQSMRTPMPPTEPNETPYKSPGASTSTNLNGNMAHLSNAENVNHHSPTHPCLEDIDKLRNLELNATKAY